MLASQISTEAGHSVPLMARSVMAAAGFFSRATTRKRPTAGDSRGAGAEESVREDMREGDVTGERAHGAAVRRPFIRRPAVAASTGRSAKASRSGEKRAKHVGKLRIAHSKGALDHRSQPCRPPSCIARWNAR